MAMNSSRMQALMVPVIFLVLFCTVVLCRPLLPIDETRYLTVAWEMHLSHGWLAPLTLNFEPYHHKPPMLFWLINLSWSIFGVSRWAALVPVFVISLSCVYMVRVLARKLFKGDDAALFDHLPLVMAVTLLFMIYGTLIMFDVTLTFFLLCALWALVSYAEIRKGRYILMMALALGLGVLTKGPVAWLYVLFPVLTGPFWMAEKGRKLSWYGGCFVAYILSVIPVLFWLVPVLMASSDDFAFWLIWEQTAGRVTGNMGSSHDRPLYFYLPLLPVMFLPWAFLPSFWKGVKGLKGHIRAEEGVRFLLCMFVPAFIAFSLIAGKQLHYMVPLLPAVVIFIAYVARPSRRTIGVVALAMMIVFVLGHIVASRTIFTRYDLQPIASYIHDHEDKDWVFARKYQGEFNFLGRLTKPLAVEQIADIPQWFKQHSDGLALIRYDRPAEVKKFQMVFTVPYRGKNMGVFKALAAPAP